MHAFAIGLIVLAALITVVALSVERSHPQRWREVGPDSPRPMSPEWRARFNERSGR